jgi:putative flippase GtrA
MPPATAVGPQFRRFAIIGALAFLVDAGVLQVVLPFAGFYAGRLVSWTAAATFTWVLNRRYTFSGGRDAPALIQWLRYLAANAIGGLANYATYALLVATVEPVRRWPVLAVAAGSVAGLLLNFFLSRRFVFGRD